MNYNGLIYEILNYYDPGCVEDGDTRQLSCLFKDDHEHGDWAKSARIYAESENYHCFKCGFTYDAISLIMEMEEIDFKSALELIKKRFYVDLSRKYKKEPRQDELDGYRDVIVQQVVDKRLKNFNMIYKAIDEAWIKKDLKILRHLLDGVKDANTRRVE